MFTGLVEGLGRVAQITQSGPGVDITIQPAEAMAVTAPSLGESVAINGCCLTVIRWDENGWVFQAGSETLSRTNLGSLKTDSIVNLERSLRPSDRLGGHFVQGHVDGTGTVDAIDKEGEWVHMSFRVPAELTKQMVSKGSIAVDGVSLTLVNVEDERFSVALIPHTLEVTTFGQFKVGSPVNIETDIIGKYMEKMLSGSSLPMPGPSSIRETSPGENR